MSDEAVAPLFPVLAYPEFADAVERAFKHPSCTQRYGQLYFNMLTKSRPEIAERIGGTALDPFYKDVISKETEQFVLSNWWGWEIAL